MDSYDITFHYLTATMSDNELQCEVGFTQSFILKCKLVPLLVIEGKPAGA